MKQLPALPVIGLHQPCLSVIMGFEKGERVGIAAELAYAFGKEIPRDLKKVANYPGKLRIAFDYAYMYNQVAGLRLTHPPTEGDVEVATVLLARDNEVLAGIDRMIDSAIAKNPELVKTKELVREYLTANARHSLSRSQKHCLVGLPKTAVDAIKDGAADVFFIGHEPTKTKRPTAGLPFWRHLAFSDIDQFITPDNDGKFPRVSLVSLPNRPRDSACLVRTGFTYTGETSFVALCEAPREDYDPKSYEGRGLIVVFPEELLKLAIETKLRLSKIIVPEFAAQYAPEEEEEEKVDAGPATVDVT